MNFLNIGKDFYVEHKNVINIISLLLNFIFIILIIILILVCISKKSESTCEVQKCVCDIEDVEITSNTFYVDVKGEVENPGVYEVESDSIINDVINMAGGFTSNAYTDNINLSRKISDELVIYVYSKKEYKSLTSTSTTSTTSSSQTATSTCETSSYDISNCTSNGQSVITASDTDTTINNTSNDDTSQTDTQSTLININTASITELMTLSGIGESKANNIIAYREENGNFSSIEDIQNVNGIGSAIFEKIKDFITV